MSMHQLFMPNQIVYGKGSFQEVGKLVSSLGKKALIISDPVMEKIGTVSQCEEYLKEQAVPYAKYVEVDSEPTTGHVLEALSMCGNESCDVIVSVGGGSCLDTAKAVAVLMTNEGYIGDYVGNQQSFSEKPLPHIAVPTTAGTGSEVTRMTVITDTENDVKMMLSHPELLPSVALIDPLLTVSCPPSITGATGVDALCHAIEAFISRRAHPVTDVMAQKAIKLITHHLRRAHEQGEDIEARDQMALGSMLAGIAFSNSSVALVHGMSRPIGALFHVPHGISNAMLLPAVLEFTKDSAIDRLAMIAQFINPGLKEGSAQELADELIKEIKLLCQDLNIPNLKTWGIDREKWDQVVSKMGSDALASGSPGNNPRVPTEEEIIQLYQICYDYDFTI